MQSYSPRFSYYVDGNALIGMGATGPMCFTILFSVVFTPSPPSHHGGNLASLSSHAHTVNVDFLRIEYMVLAKYQHMSILELILLVKQHILILCKNLLGVDVLIIVN
jgi:hypothetical protein